MRRSRRSGTNRTTIIRPAVLPGLTSLGLAISACATGGGEDRLPDPDHTIIPLPTSITWMAEDTFRITEDTRIVFDTGDAEGERIARFLSHLIGNNTETRPPVEAGPPSGPGAGVGQAVIHLTRTNADPALGDEGYALDVTSDGVWVRASTGAGLFYGVQTLRHLFPPVMEYGGAFPQPLYAVGVQITDGPRFSWRGLMLDVSRHFLEVHEVERFIDLSALYKVNRLHLHLSDDQGWRIEIPGWPRLTEYGGELEVGGTPGGFYTREDYAAIVRYAADRFVTVVPEIDLPGHTNAALASYPELNCDGVAPERFTGTAVGFSALCVGDEVTYDWLDDVVREVSALTPGAYFHVGGDEVQTLSDEEYIAFIERAQSIVSSHGKRMVGWDEVAGADLEPGSLVQLWRPYWPKPDMPEGEPETERAAAYEARALGAVEAGAQIILSPANRIYLDLKYDSTTALGLTWAGIPNVRDAYDWDPGTMFPSLPEEAIAGIEGPLWSETVASVEDFEYMAFPRLAGVAELAWTAPEARSWEEFRRRLGAQSARWTALGINFMRSPLVPWGVGPRDP